MVGGDEPTSNCPRNGLDKIVGKISPGRGGEIPVKVPLQTIIPHALADRKPVTYICVSIVAYICVSIVAYRVRNWPRQLPRPIIIPDVMDLSSSLMSRLGRDDVATC